MARVVRRDLRMHVQEISGEECRAALAGVTFGRLACVRDGQPYVVPVHFALDRDFAYLFSMFGQKIEWMRKNPRVCLEVDRVTDQRDWTSIVALGRYEELVDTLGNRDARAHARELLQTHAMWWEPGAVRLAHDTAPKDLIPVFYRIVIEQMTGRRGVPDAQT